MGTNINSHYAVHIKDFLDWANFTKPTLTDKAGRAWALEFDKVASITYWVCENNKEYLFLSYDFEGNRALTGYFTQDNENEGYPVEAVPCESIDNLKDLTNVFLSHSKSLLDKQNPYLPKDVVGESSRCRVSVYLPKAILNEVKEQSLRQDRSVSWLLQRAWALSKKEIQSYPVGEMVGSDPK